MTTMRINEIDDLTRADHPFLEASDRCFYYGEYTSRSDYLAGPINDRVSNFKKGMEKRGSLEWKWKAWAIGEIANAMMTSWQSAFIASATWVPVPPSKAKTDPLYDDRLLAVLNQIRQKVPEIDVRELVLQTTSLIAAHTSTTKRNPAHLKAVYEFQPQLLNPPLKKVIAIFDDVLTTGCHFRAMSDVILQHLPQAFIIGFFYARAVPKSDLMVQAGAAADEGT